MPRLLGRLRNYKADQGRYVRLAALWSLVALWFYGCYRLWETLMDLRWSWAAPLRTRWVDELPIVEWPLTPAAVIAAVVFLAGAAGIQMFLNRPKVADLLIETEAELRKVTWPSFRDTASASLVVLFTVAILFVLLAVFDFVVGRLIDFLLYSGR
jgi:preprotein translocase subunit SecE